MKKHILSNEVHINAEYEHITEIQGARSELENKFRLSNNADILLSHADELYRFKECLEVTTNKASTMDSHCGPAWVGFGHTFAIESEHDQAIKAYSKAAKLYPGQNLLSAEEYLLTSSQICERSVGIKRVGYAQSVDSFNNALKVVEEQNAATSMGNNMNFVQEDLNPKRST
ncbi:ApcC hetero-tetramer Cut9-Hcn1 [Gigaspora margarita]|uniref:ApcC hetero-tetramer Cut9-Hcn1 n=1 Tax=Gigaspora margarita TaxID=4874 RepID=A0A8H3XE14_GIGMA|nr:ApcC hetero-tetramer Cut9-Hcn1 [Gigaspora margarita]